MPPTQATHAGAADAPHAGRRAAWPVVLAGVCLSLPLHLGLALWLSGIVVHRPDRPEAAVVVGESPAAGEGAQPGRETASDRTEPVRGGPISPSVAMPEAALPAIPVMQGAVAPRSSAAPSSGMQAVAAPGAGAIGGDATGGTAGIGGVGSTTFFGAHGSGRRLVFLVDKSGSMASDGKMQRAADELMRSLRALPDFTQFRVGLFDTDVRIFPPSGFARARPADLDRLGGWLAAAGAQGGTTPLVAFQRLLADGSPDAIFFLTDGEIGPTDPDEIVKAANRPTGPVPVHCVAFGDRRAAAQLERIAKATGGDFRFVPLGGGS